MVDPLEHFARRVEGDAEFLAWALARYAQSERLDDRGLAERLGCPPERLTALRLCGMPAEEPAAFRRDVDAIAARFGVDAAVLATVIRHAQALERLRQPGGAAAAALLAARDRPPPGGTP